MDEEKLRELASKATPGPWSQDSDGFHCDHMVYSDTPDDNTTISTTWGVAHGVTFGQAQADAAFIAAASPSVVLSLLDRLELLEHDRDDADDSAFRRLTEIAKLTEQLDAMRSARDEACTIADSAISLAAFM